MILDGVQAVTHGSPLAFINLISSVTPTLDRQSIIIESEKAHDALFGQVAHSIGSQFARLKFIIADEDDDQGKVVVLLEELCKASAHWGAFCVMCELEANSPLFEAFRRVDFNVWAKQYIWQILPQICTKKPVASAWRLWNSSDIKAMRALHQSLVPKLFHNLEPMTRRNMLGLVHMDCKNSLTAYVDLVYGPKGIWALPIIHPDCADDPQIICDMLAALPTPGRRKVSICVRSYQPWLEHLLEQLDAERSPEQVLMVKYLALRQKVNASLELAELKNGRAETGLPVAHIEKNLTLPHLH